MAVGINILTDFDSKGISKAIAEFKKLETGTEQAGFVLKKAFLPAVAALGGLAFAGFKAAEAAAADELEQAKLAQTLEKVVGATSGTVASTEAMIKSMSRASGTADTELRAALSSLVIGTKNLTQAQEGLALAQDIATASGVPLQSAADALSKAYSGNYKALQKLSPALRDLIKDGASTEAIFADLSNTFSGATANAAETAAGKMKILKNNVAEFQESLGAALLPVLEKTTSVLTAVFGFMADNEKVVLALAAAIAILATGIVVFNIAMGIGTVVMQAFGASAVAAQAAMLPIALTIAGIVVAFVAVAAAVIYAYKNFETFRKIVNAVINFVIDIVEFFANGFIRYINSIISVINKMIDVANFFGAGLKKIGTIGEVQLGKVGQSSQMTEQQLKNLERQAVNTANAVRMIVTPENQLKTQADRYTQMALSMGKFVDYTGKGYKEVSTSGGAVESAADKLKKYIDAIKGVTSAQRSLRDANKAVDESNKTLLEKTNALTEAQKRFNLITKGYGKESKEAKDAEKERSKAERAAERAKYALEQAVFAVKEAELELAEVRKDPKSTPQMIREAEIKLAQAKLSVADATDSQKESVDALTASQQKLDEVVNGAKEGSDAYKDALNDLLSAEKDQRDAIDARVAAYERLADATRDLADAEQERREAGKGVSKTDRETADAAANAASTVVIPAVVSVLKPAVDAVKDVVDTIAAPIAALPTPSELEQIGRIGRGDFSGIDLGVIRIPTLEELLGGGIGTLMADGGVVTRATSIIAGEAGAEAIIPLDRMGSMGSTYNIQVTAGMGADGKDIGTQIVNALKRYERTNGALPLTVA